MAVGLTVQAAPAFNTVALTETQLGAPSLYQPPALHSGNCQQAYLIDSNRGGIFPSACWGMFCVNAAKHRSRGRHGWTAGGSDNINNWRQFAYFNYRRARSKWLQRQ